MLVWNVRGYIPAGGAYGQAAVGPDVLAQLEHVGLALRRGGGERMQELFPEGYFFSHVLYGLAWVDAGQRYPSGDPVHARALSEARWALERLEGPRGMAPFSPSLDPPRGVFYVGWSTWLRGRILQLDPALLENSDVSKRFHDDCDALAAAFAVSETPFLAAYPGQAWPVDSTVAVAALRLHDDLVDPRYGDVAETWLSDAQQRLDRATGLLPHRVDAVTGAPLEGARGTSQSIIQRFLPLIDAAWAGEQYRLFRVQFVRTRFGLPGVLEYPAGVAGRGDIDSGPLVMGFSVSASAVTIGSALTHGDRALAEPLIHLAEVTGLPIRWCGRKVYLMGALPVGDAFLVWAKAAPAHPADRYARIVTPLWRWPWHLLSASLVALCWRAALRARPSH
jgi:hypothetical protein